MAIRYQQFVDGVRERADLPAAEDARHTAVNVIEVIAGYLDGVDQQQLATVLPGKISEKVHWDRSAVGAVDSEGELVAEVARKAGVSPERGRYLTQAVLSELAADESSLAESLRHRLPSEIIGMFEAPGHGPPPDWAAAEAEARPRPLDSDELSRALGELVDWSGTTEQISRLVGLPKDRFSPLMTQVKAAEKELSHHASIDERDDGILFSLRTWSLEAVTELDLQLARRIDAAVTEVSSGG
ncbi:DUF2267 domain-containing protein [Parasphingorhabdus pacifica]